MTHEKITGSAEFRSFTRDKKDFYRAEYLSYDDPSGYIFAEAWVEDGYRKWVEMQNAFGVKDEFKEWKNTLEMKLQAQGIINIARQKDTSFQAAKWLADRGWAEKSDKRTKEHKKRTQEAVDHIKEDMERLGLKVV